MQKLLIIILSFLIVNGSSGCASSNPLEKQSASPDSTKQIPKIINQSELEEEEEDEEIPESEVIESPEEITPRVSISEDNPAIDRHELLSEIMPLMRKPYRKKGTGANGFDCSGFTLSVYKNILGMDLPHSSRIQYNMGKLIERDSLKIGDLVFFKTRKRVPSHVGIYVGDGLFAHASLKIGVTISLLDGKYYKRRYIGARRIVD